MKNLITPRNALRLTSLGVFIVGLFSFIFPNGVLPILGGVWWFDVFEGYFHFTVSASTLIASLILSDRQARWFLLIIGIGAVIVGLYGFLLSGGPVGTFNTFGVANLENPADNLFHFVGGILALAVVYISRGQPRAESSSR